MRVTRRNGNLAYEARAQSLDGPNRSGIVRVAGDDHLLVNGADKRGDGTAGLQRVAVPSKRLLNLESDVPRANPDVLPISNAKVDVADLHAVGGKDLKMVIRDEAASRLRLVSLASMTPMTQWRVRKDFWTNW